MENTTLVNQNTLHGAGDGVIVEGSPAKRFQVPSARKFATRGVVNDAAVQEKLQEALESFFTPPESPLGRRSLTIAEIKPVTGKQPNKNKAIKRNGSEKTNKRQVQNGGRKVQEKKNNDDRYVVDAGRRVSHQLVVNAWRQRRSQVASLVESRDAMQNQINQLHLQINVLQKLRKSESLRRSEALQENQNIKQSLEKLNKVNQDLLQQMEKHKETEASLNLIITELRENLINEINTNKKLTEQKSNTEKWLQNEKTNVASLKEDIKKLSFRITESEREILNQKRNCKDYQDVIRMSEDKYAEQVEICENLKKDYQMIQRSNELLHKEKQEVEELLSVARGKTEKMEMKMHDLKKLLLTARQLKKRTAEENEQLKGKLEDIGKMIRDESAKKWWLKTGQFFGRKFIDVAYLLFPAMPSKLYYANGKLTSLEESFDLRNL